MSASAVFDSNFYLTNNLDVVVAISQGNFANALDHYNRFGGKELRAPNASFDASYYAINNSDVLDAVSAGTFSSVFAHYQEFGETENRAPNLNLASFDAAGYLAANTDVATAVSAGSFTSALDHFIQFGQNESRTGSGVTESVTVGSTLTLTSGTDSGSGFVGTAAADTFNADLINESGVANVTTINSTDVIDGGAGNDTLNATYDDATSATVSNIETLNLSGRAGVAFDFVNISGMTTLNMSAYTAAANLDNIAALPTTLNVTNMAQDANIDFAAAAVAGTADALAMTVQSVTAGTYTLDAGIETLSIASNGNSANTITEINASITGLTVTGAQNLTVTNHLGTNTAALTTVNAAAMTGRLNVTQDDAVNVTITGGTGNDTIDLGADNFDANDTVDGGAGTDKLAMEEDDTIALTTAGNNLTNVTNIETIDVTDQLAGNISLNIFNGATTMELSGGIDGTDRTVTVGSGDTIDLEADAGDDITITVNGSGTSDTVNLILDDADVTINVQATSVETLNITTTGTADGGANIIAGTTVLNALAGDQGIVITGAEALTFTGLITADSVNGSAMTDVLTVTAGSTAGAQITGGSANDILTVGDGNADVIDGGAGNDIITFDIEVTDTLTGGAGNDVFLMDNDTDVTAAGAVITDLETNDDLDLDESTIEVNTAGGTAVAELTDFAGADITGADNMIFVTVAADNTALTSGDIAVITGTTYADATAALADIQTAGARTFSHVALTDEDGCLIAYELTSGGVELALVANEGGGTTSNGFDAIDVLVTMTNLTNSTVQNMDIDTVA